MHTVSCNHWHQNKMEKNVRLEKLAFYYQIIYSRLYLIKCWAV